MFSLPMIFAAGLLSFASPCILPMIPVYLATLAGGATSPGASSRRVLSMAIAFASGLSLVFVALGALAASVAGVLMAYRPWLIGASILMMLLFGLRAWGLFRSSVLDAEARPLLARFAVGGSLLSAFVFGAAFALGWSPCIGPLLASLLTYSATHADSPWQSAGYLGVYAAGFSAPLLIFAALAARATSIVRKLNRLIPTFERVTGTALIVVAGVLMYTEFVPSLPSSEPLAQATSSSASVAPSAVIALPASASAPLAQAAPAPTACSPHGEQGAACVFEHDEAPSSELSPSPSLAGPHVLEFVSGTCPACERMRPVTENVRRACGQHEVPMVAVDVGEGHGRALALRHAVRGTPTFVFLDSNGEELSRLVGETDAGKFIDTIDDAFGITCQLGEPRHGSRPATARESAG